MVHLLQSLWLNARPALIGIGGVLAFILAAAAFLSGLGDSLAAG